MPSAVDNEDTMYSQALLGSVMDSLRSEESRRGAALGATESTAPLSPPPEPMPFEKVSSVLSDLDDLILCIVCLITCVSQRRRGCTSGGAEVLQYCEVV